MDRKKLNVGLILIVIGALYQEGFIIFLLNTTLTELNKPLMIVLGVIGICPIIWGLIAALIAVDQEVNSDQESKSSLNRDVASSN